MLRRSSPRGPRAAGPASPDAGSAAGAMNERPTCFRTARQNDDVGVMRAFAQRLTDSEIEALGQYYAGAR